MQWWVILVAGFAAIFIAFIAVSFQSVKAALANPVESLKTE
jgi:putative ABC transport system permease protein